MDAALTPTLLWLPTLLSALVSTLSVGLLMHSLRRMNSSDLITASVWWVAGAVTCGSGLWAAQYFALSAVELPWELAYRPNGLGVTWLVAVLGSAVVLSSTKLKLREEAMVVVQAVLWAILWWGVMALAQRSFVGVSSLSVVTQRIPLAPMGLVFASGMAALWLAFGTRWADLGKFSSRQWVGACIFGLLAGMAQDIAISRMGFQAAAVLTEGTALDRNVIQLVSSGGTLAVLLGLFGVLVDSRAHGRNLLLASSLSEANRRLRDLALADPLTRLPNRTLFEEKLNEALERVGTDPSSLAVLFIDLDGFKPVNDSFGHVAGDAVLRDVGRRLQQLARQSDVVARVGGDEFLLLAERPGGDTGAAQVAQRVLDAVSQPYTLPNGVEVNLSCSVGIVMYPEGGPAKKLLANSDAAMYAAKRAGGSTYAFFESSMEQDARNQLEIQHDLRSAIERSELELYYQPKIDGKSGQITGAEALIRWHHPKRGLVMPGIFIPVAERFGLIGALGNWVLEESCRQLREWLDQGLRMRVAVNLSVHQLRQEDLVQRIRRSVESHRIDASLLTFEITESVAMEDTQATMKAFAQLAHLGSTVSIDDFGTGYSSLAYLRKLPARQLKIDRSFVMDLDTSTDALAVVDAVIKLAHALGLRVVAEGVETARQRDILLSLNCDELQGYFFAKPMSAAKLTLWAMVDDKNEQQDFRPSLYVSGHQMLQ
ncbi:putative bifunctional diguanylate cyclase/phosphodiesterase [Ideonella paludis]|uniref:EAL domain-containing protein n=1 Tax=Ideonella paludis TaxID=1233411 RepID=A0ABS5E2E6_9BURK|nr:EAL domain-containing protein [Ideonella paludis]MBQ0937585.1 EAL domain-containing protein [Ideonella paludis]